MTRSPDDAAIDEPGAALPDAASGPLMLYDSRRRERVALDPIDPADVRLYLCGPTVYDRPHLGNARGVLVFDVLFRLLRLSYGADAVRYARNITDVDDKINARAAASGRPIGAITDETVRWFHEDMDAVGVLRPTHEPRATRYVAEMVAMIADLIAAGHAYAAEGHVLFSVASDPGYGSLSGRNVDDMTAGARVEVAPFKRDPMDFVLWKPSEDVQPGWDSPWGRGRPGWHIECSAMTRALFGPAFDIHGGGTDLTFPHHENELAQSSCADPGAGFARIWLHNEMLQVDGRKMSKSLGNFFTVRDLLDRGIPGEVIRFVVLSTHYRKPMDWTDGKADAATKVLEGWRQVRHEAGGPAPAGVLAALRSDLNTPGAIAELHRLARLGAAGDDAAARDLSGGLALLGFGDLAGLAMSPPGPPGDVAARIDALLAERSEARATRDFARADAIRAALDAAGVEVQDAAGVPSAWSLKPGFDPGALERFV